jgi:hypothetical protein
MSEPRLPSFTPAMKNDKPALMILGYSHFGCGGSSIPGSCRIVGCSEVGSTGALVWRIKVSVWVCVWVDILVAEQSQATGQRRVERRGGYLIKYGDHRGLTVVRTGFATLNSTIAHGSPPELVSMLGICICLDRFTRWRTWTCGVTRLTSEKAPVATNRPFYG